MVLEARTEYGRPRHRGRSSLKRANTASFHIDNADAGAALSNRAILGWLSIG